MMNEAQPDKPPTRSKWPKRFLIGLVVAIVCGAGYVWTHPLVFNESFWQHAHCITQAGGALSQYASAHDGRFPMHTNGYGDALLLLLVEGYVPSYALTGPGFDRFVFDRALPNNTNVAEAECGRVYVQGLSETNNPEIAILFDKVATPGGDHCHGLARVFSPLCREVLFIGRGHRIVRETGWQRFTRNQIALLVEAGFSQSDAEAVYAEKGEVR